MQTECMICLDTLQDRGGRALLNPGCCGKTFHLDCIINCNNCPNCREIIAIREPTSSRASSVSTVFRRFSSLSSIFRRSSLSSVPAVAANPTTVVIPTTSEVLRLSAIPPSPPLAELSETEDLIPPKPISLPIQNSNPDEVLDVQVNVLTEFERISTAGYDDFHARVQVKYNRPDVVAEHIKAELDVICIIDNSGSMGDAHFGETKLSYLKSAMDFIIDSMSPCDRLSIVNFNSTAKCIHGFRLMNTEEKKLASKTALHGLTAAGGTNIYAGMRKGQELLQNRQTANPSSAVFLLTDGQDRDKLSQKLDSARQMKVNGSALYVFGFGADHDSQHLMEIAKAGEGSFVYVADNDQIIDAFGGALGAVQGRAIRDISLTIRSPTCHITNTFAGDYNKQWNLDRSGVEVSFANMFPEEARDVLVQLRVPAVDTEVVAYPILKAQAQYAVPYSDGQSSKYQTDEVLCAVDRVQDSHLLVTDKRRDVEVDVQLNRLATTEAVRQSLSMADNGDFTSAREVIRVAIAKIESSIACEVGHMSAAAMLGDLQQALSSLERSAYSLGGRAAVTETCSANMYQRKCYSKAGASPMYQSVSSMNSQTRARNSKTPSISTPSISTPSAV